MSDKRNLYDMIQDNILDGRTYDMVDLRYRGDAINVFLWDDMQDWKILKQYIPDFNLVEDFRNGHKEIETVDNYLPWYYLEGDDDRSTANEYYPARCLEDAFDVEFLDLPDYCFNEPKPIRGRLAKVSLKMLTKLDEYYDNEHYFSRQEIELTSPLKRGTIIKAYSWFNTFDDLFESSTGGFTLKGDGDLTPFNEEHGVYQMGRY